MQYRKPVYICSPYMDNPKENYQKALEYCRLAYEQGYLPIAPHTIFTQFLDENLIEEREEGLEMGLQLLQHFCVEMWVFGPKITEGMRKEIDFARKKGIPIKFFNFIKTNVLEGVAFEQIK